MPLLPDEPDVPDVPCGSPFSPLGPCGPADETITVLRSCDTVTFILSSYVFR
jgi:hypothetical protein